MVGRLRDIVVMTGILFCQTKGDDGGMGVIGGTLLAPHMDGGRIREYFGIRRLVGGAEVSEMIVREGIPTEIQAGCDFERELVNGYDKSAVITEKSCGEQPQTLSSAGL